MNTAVPARTQVVIVGAGFAGLDCARALAGAPVDAPAKGTLDVDTPIPHNVLSVESLRNLELHDYEVLIFPDGNYTDRLGKRGIE